MANDNSTAASWPLDSKPLEGRKDDHGKAQIELVAPELIFAVARVLGFGAVKYAPRNWEKGMAWGRVFGATMRHLWAWWGGKGPTPKSFLFGDLDDETRFSHLWHAACCIMFLIAYEERGVGVDDRHAKPADDINVDRAQLAGLSDLPLFNSKLD